MTGFVMTCSPSTSTGAEPGSGIGSGSCESEEEFPSSVGSVVSSSANGSDPPVASFDPESSPDAVPTSEELAHAAKRSRKASRVGSILMVRLMGLVRAKNQPGSQLLEKPPLNSLFGTKNGLQRLSLIHI